ncbi:PREDICTED: interferon-induced protein with tetratricopeptide repeats 1-like [Acanthisitta chloris]|uniref:interferon-induced protein with tetratricopeptide repeats 1-like n=1 Tax=Acanthisitta chloris TaxID=57068 RepID=UPI0004F0DAA7|nr:PREDICTED: interferon-induced protein with tetratricopeptide repeats 1-like [Acanthisitta chloris]
MSNEQLLERLDALQCHFTWELGVKGCFNPTHILQKVAVELRHTMQQNQAALLGLQAYLYVLNNQNKEQQQAATATSLITCGNYAWIKYLQAEYQEAEEYLEQIQQLCPAPWDARLIPHIQVQKGWSLLVVRSQNGERARECFEAALMLEPDNDDFHAGLGQALFASSNYFWSSNIASRAISQLERTIDRQPNDYRAKIYLADLFKRMDEKKRAMDLIKECAENSSDPEVLKRSALYYLSQSAARAVEILKQALQENPDYHLLYQALAKCYKKLWLTAEDEDKNDVLDAAIRHLEQIVQDHPDCDLTLTKLQLAELYGARNPSQEEDVYKELQEQSESLSLRGRQVLNHNWGKFCLYKKRSRHEALEKFMVCYKIPLNSGVRHECARMMRKMALNCSSEDANFIFRFIDDVNYSLPMEFAEKA